MHIGLFVWFNARARTKTKKTIAHSERDRMNKNVIKNILEDE
jgi:hypothetical protein